MIALPQEAEFVTTRRELPSWLEIGLCDGFD